MAEKHSTGTGISELSKDSIAIQDAPGFVFKFKPPPKRSIVSEIEATLKGRYGVPIIAAIAGFIVFLILGLLVIVSLDYAHEYQDCMDAKSRNMLSPTVRISPDNGPKFTVACDHKHDGGGWTLILRRNNRALLFNQSWDNYKEGFGTVANSHWLGNDYIHRLTAGRLQSLRVSMLGIDGEMEFYYGVFAVSAEAVRYRLRIGDYNPRSTGNVMRLYNNKLFSTPDVNSDIGLDCGAEYKAGWWFATGCLDGLLPTAEWQDKGLVCNFPSTGRVEYAQNITMMVRGLALPRSKPKSHHVTG